MRTWRFAAAMLGAAAGACGDDALPAGEPLAPAVELAIVAHPGDDLLFLQSDLLDAAQRGGGLTNVYVTTGSDEPGVDPDGARDGLLAAYGAIAGGGGGDWTCGWIELAGHAALHCRLPAARISLVFLGYPDGGADGGAPDSLLHLWSGQVASVATVGRRTARYDRDGLVATLAAVIDATAPATVRTLDIASTHGRDHADHALVGAIAVPAIAASPRRPALISYRGYNVEDEPADTGLAPALYDRSLDALARFEACAIGCAPCGRACPADAIRPDHTAWLARRYAVGVRRAASGQLRIADGCVSVTDTGGNASIADCAGATSWQLDDRGALRSTTGRCLEVILTGEVVAGTCDPLGAGGRFFLDDDGHLWSGITPPALDGLLLAHLYCVGQAGGRPRAGLCGDGRAPAWELARTTTATDRATAAITRTGRAVRLARFAGDARPRLCAIEAGRGLVCAAGAPDGGLSPAVRIDRPDAPLAIEPESLVLGDVDGDGATDACGRDAGGLSCATAASGFAATRWAIVLGASGPATATDRSLAIVPGGQICGLADAGVVCVARGATALTDVRSTWPDRGAALWLAELDGDHLADWCAATPGGPACGLARHRAITTDGVPWAYAAGGRAENSAADGALPDTATATFTDVDGDGRDDLCTAAGGVIACAPSLGGSFGPRTPIARLPAGMIPTGVWAEPATPGEPPRLCAGDATTIACTE